MGDPVILLDTNVLSEYSKPAPNVKVTQWLEAVDAAETWISSITVAEMRLGAARLPEGKRKTAVTSAVEASLNLFKGSCLAFDAVAAEAYAQIVAAQTQKGRPIGIMDAQIAAIAMSTGCTLATLNAWDFDGIEGLAVADLAIL